MNLRHIAGENAPGLGREKVIHTGGNGGYQAMNLVYLLGARKIILLGFDMQRTEGKSHWHGDHPGQLNRSSAYPTWIQNFNILARDLRDAGVDVVNATRATALHCFKQVNLEDALCR